VPIRALDKTALRYGLRCCLGIVSQMMMSERTYRPPVPMRPGRDLSAYGGSMHLVELHVLGRNIGVLSHVQKRRDGWNRRKWALQTPPTVGGSWHAKI